MTDFTLQFKVTADGKLAIKGLKEVEDAAKKSGKGLDDSFKASADSANKMPAALGGVTRALGGIFTATSALTLAKYMIQTADNAILAQARIKLVTRSLDEQKQVYEELYRIANQVQLPANEVINSYPRMARAIRDVGGSSREALDIVKAFAISVKVSGATQQEAAAAAIQFAQALGSGRLQGDELRSMMENNSLLMEKLAKGLGVTTGELRKMGEEGLLTTAKIKQSLLSQLPELEKEMNQMPRTVAGAWTELRNEQERSIASSKAVAGAQSWLAEQLRGVAAAQRLVNDTMKASGSADMMQRYSKWVSENSGKVASTGFDAFLKADAQRRANTPDWGTMDAKDLRNANEDRANALAASTRRQFEEALKDAGGLDATLSKINSQISALATEHANLVIQGRATVEDTRRFEATFADLQLKSQEAINEAAKRGTASFSQRVTVIERTLEAERAAFETSVDLQQQLLKRQLDELEHQHSMALVSEQDYATRRTAILVEQARNEESIARNRLNTERRAQAAIAAVPARDVGERDAKEAKLAESKKKVVELAGEELKKNREINFARDEGRQLEDKIGEAVKQRLRDLARETEDRRRSLQDEVDQLQLQLDLIGLTEKAQQRLIIEEKARAEVVKETLAAERDIAELKRKNADPAEIAARQNARDQRIADINASAEVKKGLADKIIDKQVQDRIAQRVAEALMNARSLKDAAKSIGRILEDELKNQIITVYLKPALKEGVDALFKFAQTGDFGSMSPQAQAGLTMMLGGFAGGGGARALGAGQRGQQVGAITGAAGAQLGMMVGGPVGAVIGALAGAVIGKFTDPNGLANRTAIVGKNPGDPGGFRWNSRFGDAGIFNSHWFNAEQHEGLSQFTAMMARLENSIAQRLKPDEIARISNTINAPKQYSFGIEHSDQSDELLGILRDRLAIIVEGVLPGLGKLVSEFQGSGEEMANFVDSLLRLRDMTSDFDRLIAQVTDNAADLVRSQIEQLKSAVDTAQQAFDTARANKDATAMIAAEENLTNAIIEHYQVRVNMARQLQQNLRDIDEQSYNFSLQMAQRINALGGSINIGSLAGGRAAALYGQLGTGDVASRLKGLQGYVGARETEYNARREEILRNAQAQIDAQAAIANWQSQANQTMIAALQQELALAQQFSGVVDKTRGIMESFKYGPTNPLHALGRLGLANDDLEGLKAAYNGATGANRAGAANRYAEALQRRMGMVNEADIQRPSGEYLTYFNATMEELTRVQADAQAEADRQAALQDRIASLSELSNGYQATTADATTVAADYLNALDAEFRSYYEDANAIGERLYDEQRRAAKEALDAATGGVEVDLFIAQMQKESRDKLTEMVELMKAFLAAGGTVVPTGGTGTTTTGGTGTPIGTGGGGGGGGGSGGVETLLPVAVQIGDTNFANLVLRTVVSNGRVVRQTVEQS